jgi:hypothetical protein
MTSRGVGVYAGARLADALTAAGGLYALRLSAAGGLCALRHVLTAAVRARRPRRTRQRASPVAAPWQRRGSPAAGAQGL